ncbi:SMI1/KNR4 family protein [Deinococcus sp. QL22]|uniref:SMI1/KNR4 family protein n=1 Tax=Deinococcus sp. QL22 TaxID=2939437 RepID=UPI002016A964|nr:SMI1/KNR4 family protein [Deinococcus sp. QL22]UQN06254.1 SMI1/KNR4 family protein [Deinococcus sp. QL22]
MDTYNEALAVLDALPRPDPALPQGLAADALHHFETRFGVHVPQDVHEWLRRTNGAFVDSQAFLGIAPDMPNDMGEVLTHYPHWVQAQWLPVAVDGCGNVYVVALDARYGPSHPVLFMDHEDGMDQPAYLVASSFRHFVPLFIRKEQQWMAWPFDRALTLALDPELASCTGAPWPWDT